MTLKGLRRGKGGLDCKRLGRLEKREGAALVRRAYDGGMRLFAATREYPGIEERVARGLEGVERSEYLLLADVRASDAEDFRRGLDESLRALGTEYVDVLCLRGIRPEDMSDELREAMTEAKRSRKVRSLGLAPESLECAREAVCGGFFDAVVYPLNSLSAPEELELAALAEEHGVYFFASMPMAGGLLRSAACAMAFLRDVGKVHPLWGAEYPWQIDETAALERKPPRSTKLLRERIEGEREMNAGMLCRGCGECMPCPVGIDIPFAARAGYIIHIAPRGAYTDAETRGKMRLATKCVGCGYCADRCRFGLNVRGLILRGVNEYREYMWEQGEEWE